MPERSNEQKLVDLCFSMAMTLHMNQHWLEMQSRDELAEWVAKQLKDGGFPTKPCGISWGVLIEPNFE